MGQEAVGPQNLVRFSSLLDPGDLQLSAKRAGQQVHLLLSSLDEFLGGRRAGPLTRSGRSILPQCPDGAMNPCSNQDS